MKRLIITCLLGGTAGWVLQGMLGERFIFWTLPLFLIGTFILTINGDNIIEAFVVLGIAGICAFIASRSDAVVSIIGNGTIPGIYTALVISKILFALVKE